MSIWALPSSPKSSSASSMLQSRNTKMVVEAGKPSHLLPFPPPIHLCHRKPWSTFLTALSFSHSHKYYPLLSAPLTTAPSTKAILQDQRFISAPESSDQISSDFDTQLYVCNLPRNYGISELLESFRPYGTVHSVEVSRNAETGISRGCGYVTMSSTSEAKAAIADLDASDVGGREMRVRFSAQMTRGTNNLLTQRNLTFESPYKIYVGNLAWSVTPADLRNLFCQFGTVVSSRVLHDRKTGKKRVYGFLSFSSAAEREAAISLDGTEFCGRKLLVRDVLEKKT